MQHRVYEVLFVNRKELEKMYAVLQEKQEGRTVGQHKKALKDDLEKFLFLVLFLLDSLVTTLFKV